MGGGTDLGEGGVAAVRSGAVKEGGWRLLGGEGWGMVIGNAEYVA